MNRSTSNAFEFQRLEDRLLLSGDVVISEFLAANDSGLTDIDGDRSDWIELYNRGDEAVDLDGYYLTDKADLSELWEIPAVTLAPGEFKLIFASGKDLDDPVSELHTNFKLSKGGEYLGLIAPDGVSVVFDYGQEFPEQVDDVSYGLNFDQSATESIYFIGEHDSAKTLVPDSASWASDWMLPGFDDSAWFSGSTSVGYETSPDSDTSYEGYYSSDVESSMYSQNASLLMRTNFTVENAAQLISLTLTMRYDDGFVAYINGVEVASANAPTSRTYNSSATTSHSDSVSLTQIDFDVSVALSALVDGENVLAIHALNAGVSSSDFLCSAALSGDVLASVTDQPAYFATPTPEAANISGTLGFVEDTKFSVDRGFYDSPFELEISCATDGAQIRYTLDGSTPTQSNGILYSGPIEITGLTTLRAVAFKAGYQPSDVDAQTYIFISDVLVQPDDPAGYPDIWNGDNYTRPADYGLDPEVVYDPAYVDLWEQAFTSIPTMSITTDIENLFDSETGIYIKATRSGMDYERPCTVEYFDASGEGFTINCGIRMRGGASRSQRTTPKHSFRLVFRDMYGDSKLNYPLFGSEATDSFDTIILRAGSNLSWAHHNGWPVYSENRQYAQYVRDTWAKQTQLDMGWISCANNYAHLYINGIYWGLYNPGERPSAPFASDYAGGDKEDYDVINSGEAIDGDLTAWNELMALSQQDMSISSNYEAISDMLDLEAFSDYMIVNQYGGNIDWDHHNWHAFRNREAGGKWYFVMWDTEIVFVNLQENRIDPSRFGYFEPSSDYVPNENTLTRMWLGLLENEDYKTLFADRVHKYFFNDGLLTPDSVVERWNAISDVVYDPIICESARWGDYRRDVYYAGRASFDDHQLYDRDEEWAAERQRLLEDYFPYRSAVVVNQYKAFGAYPQIDAPVISLNSASQHGGSFDTGDLLGFDADEGTILYTLDGSDPRVSGGSISPLAQQYDGSDIALGDNVTVSARVYLNGQWSAMAQADFICTAASSLVISEVNYNPAAPSLQEIAAGFDDNDMFEFIELHNSSSEAVSLGSVALAGGISFSFDDGNIASIPAGGYVVVVKNADAFQMRYGSEIAIAGTYSGKLSNSGETLRLVYGADSAVLIEFAYEDGGDWSGRADGKGATLVLKDALADPSDSDSWRSSVEYLGSPGVAAADRIEEIIINEVLTHTDLPQVDSIELRNVSSHSVDISGWYLSDSSGDYLKFRIPDSTVIPAGGYIVFNEYDFNASGLDLDPANDVDSDFAFDGAHGDDLWLMAADSGGNLTRFIDHIEFDASANGLSLSRMDNADGELAVTQPTLGYANGQAVFGDVVISEIMYNPNGLTSLPQSEVFYADFESYDSRFTFVDDAFGTNAPGEAAGAIEDGVAKVNILASGSPGDYSGGWSVDFSTDNDGAATISFSYEYWLLSYFNRGDSVSFFVSIDGQNIGSLAGGSFDFVNTPAPPVGYTQVTTDVIEVILETQLASGDHTLCIGVEGDFSNASGGSVMMEIHDLQISASDTAEHMEFIELLNTSDSPVDLAGWQLTGGVDFVFDESVILAPGECVLVVDFDPDLTGGSEWLTGLRQCYGIDASVAVVGGYFGKLSNGGESITLLAPDTPPTDEPDYTPMLTVDRVKYKDSSPYSTLADGMGRSLVRLTDGYGRLASSWVAANPTAGDGFMSVKGDFNGDGTVDLDDFILLKQNYGTTDASVNTGDANGDATVNLDDFIALKQNYGNSSTSAVASVGGVSAGADGETVDLLAGVQTASAPAPLPLDRAVQVNSFDLLAYVPDELL